MNLPRPVTILALALGLLGVSLLCAVSHRTLERWAGAEHYRAGEQERNPYFPSMSQIAQRHGLNVEQLQILERGRAFDLTESRLFQLQDKSLDVLIVGDSSAVWGFSPTVASQVSGQRVGIFAYEQARPTYQLLNTVDELAQTYLRDGGLVVLCFSPQGWDRSLKGRQSGNSLQKVSALGDQRLQQFIAQKRKPSLFSGEAMAKHWNKVETVVGTFPWVGPAKLPDLAVYATWIEPWIAPKIAQAARENAEDAKHSFYLWDEWNSVLEICASCLYQAPRDQTPKGKKPSKRMAAAAKQARKLPHRLAFVITFYGDAKRSAKLRGLYEQELKNGVALIDLEAMWPKQLKVATQGGSHVVNEGALYQSLLLGEWLKRFKSGDANPNRQLEGL